MKVKEESEKADLKTQHSRNEDYGFQAITSWEIDGETVETKTDFIFLHSKITEIVITAIKLKDTCSLKEKLQET